MQLELLTLNIQFCSFDFVALAVRVCYKPPRLDTTATVEMCERNTYIVW